MTFEDNPADERYELDLCIQEINNLKAERDSLKAELEKVHGSVSACCATIDSLTEEKVKLQSQLTSLQTASVDEVEELRKKSERFVLGNHEAWAIIDKSLDLARTFYAQIAERDRLLKWLDANIPEVGDFLDMDASAESRKVSEILNNFGTEVPNASG